MVAISFESRFEVGQQQPQFIFIGSSLCKHIERKKNSSRASSVVDTAPAVTDLLTNDFRYRKNTYKYARVCGNINSNALLLSYIYVQR